MSSTKELFMARSPSPVVSNEDLFAELLKEGAEFLKYGRKGKPHRCHVRCSPELDKITWGKKGVASSSDLVEVRIGRKTDVFARADEEAREAKDLAGEGLPSWKKSLGRARRTLSRASPGSAAALTPQPTSTPTKPINPSPNSLIQPSSSLQLVMDHISNPATAAALQTPPRSSSAGSEISFSLVFHDRTLDLEVLPGTDGTAEEEASLSGCW